MKRSHCCILALLTTVACDLQDIPFGSTEAPKGLDCYQWSVHKSLEDGSRTGPTAMMFDEGELILAGSPYPRSVVLDDGNGHMIWESRFNADEDVAENNSFVRSMVPRDEGGVIAAVQTEDAIIIDTIDVDGARLGAFEVATGPTSPAHVELLDTGDGLALSTIHTANDQYTLTLHKLDAELQTLWTHEVELDAPIDAPWWFDGGLVQLPSGDLVQVASTMLEGDEPGARFIRITPQGVTAADVKLQLDAFTNDIAVHPSGDVFVLAETDDRIEVLRIDPQGEIQWKVRPREGEGVEASHIAWDAHTQRVMIAGGTRPSGETMHGYWVVLNERGGQEWSYVGGPDSETTQQLVAAPSGGFVTADWSAKLRLHQFVASTCD